MRSCFSQVPRKNAHKSIQNLRKVWIWCIKLCAKLLFNFLYFHFLLNFKFIVSTKFIFYFYNITFSVFFKVFSNYSTYNREFFECSNTLRDSSSNIFLIFICDNTLCIDILLVIYHFRFYILDYFCTSFS